MPSAQIQFLGEFELLELCCWLLRCKARQRDRSRLPTLPRAHSLRLQHNARDRARAPRLLAPLRSIRRDPALLGRKQSAAKQWHRMQWGL